MDNHADERNTLPEIDREGAHWEMEDAAVSDTWKQLSRIAAETKKISCS